MFRVAGEHGEVDIDWLTCQGREKEEQQWIWAVWNEWLDLHGYSAGTLQPKKLSSGYALTLEQLGVTWRQTGQCSLWASGEHSATLARQRGTWLPSVSRMDIQATVRLVMPSRKLHSRLREHWRSGASPKANRMYTRIIESDTGGTVELGRRKSPRFMRVYDKGGEQGTAPLGEVWRFELELKGKQADDTFGLFREAGDGQGFLLGVLQDYLRKVDVSLAIPNLMSNGAMAALRPNKPDEESRIVWLKHSVRPVIAELARAGLLPQAMKAMGLKYQKGETKWLE